MKLRTAAILIVVGGVAGASGEETAERGLSDVRVWGGRVGLFGDFSSVFDNTEYSSVRLPKPDERTYFFSDFVGGCDLRPRPGITVKIGGRVVYEFGDDVAGGPGPRAQARLRGDFDTTRHHWTFGHFRDEASPATFVMRDYDDDLAGVRYRLTAGAVQGRLFLTRVSTVGEERYETFAYGGRGEWRPGRLTELGVNLGGIHEGGFDAGVGSPPTNERKREVSVGSFYFRQDIWRGIYAAGEAVVSMSRSDRFDGTVRDNAYWGGFGYRRGPLHAWGRFWMAGWAFETPWGERWLRNEEGIAILDDYYAWTAGAAVAFDVGGVSRLTLGGEGGVKYLTRDLQHQDFNFNIQLIRFQVYL